MLTLINTIEHLKKARRMYLQSEGDCGEELAVNLLDDASTLGVQDVYKDFIDGWWVVWSVYDWLKIENDYSIIDTFNKLVPLIGGGLNAVRREVLLTAFAKDVLTIKDNKIELIKGEMPNLRWVKERIIKDREGARIILFRSS